MVDRIRSVPWSSYENAYEEGSETMEALLTAAWTKRDEQSFQQLTGYLKNNLVHQGTIYPSTAAALPFAIELLEIAPVSQQKELLRFVVWALEGVDQYAMLLSWDSNVTELPADLSFLRACREAVAAKLDYFVALLTHTNPDVRMFVPQVLDRFVNMPVIVSEGTIPPSTARNIFDRVTGLYAQQDLLERCSFAMLLKKLRLADAGTTDTLLRLYTAEHDDKPKAFLALALADRKQYDVALPSIQHTLRHINELDSLYNNDVIYNAYRFFRYRLTSWVCQLPPQYIPALIDGLVNIIALTHPSALEHEIKTITAFVFQGQQPDKIPPSQRTPEQTKLLAAIAIKKPAPTQTSTPPSNAKPKQGSWWKRFFRLE